MGRLTRLREKYGTDIGDVIDDLTVLTPMNDLQLREVYSDEELRELRDGLIAVQNATDQNEKERKLLELSSKFVKAAGNLGFAV